MELSEAQKHLILGLRIFGVEKDAIYGIVSALSELEQQDEMMEWMCDHRNATMAQILKEVANIVNKNQE